VLIPTLKPDGIVALDNLPAHKIAAVRAAIEKGRATLSAAALLARYEPDRDGLRHAQDTAPPIPRTNPRRPVEPHRRVTRASPQTNATTTSVPPVMPTHSENALGKPDLPGVCAVRNKNRKCMEYLIEIIHGMLLVGRSIVTANRTNRSRQNRILAFWSALPIDCAGLRVRYGLSESIHA
jgi:hypothetical protein